MNEAEESPGRRIERLERELRLARAEIEEFTRAVSHDLRAPLRHLGAYAQILREDLPEAQRVFAYMPYMHSESAVIHEIAQRLFASLAVEDKLKLGEDTVLKINQQIEKLEAEASRLSDTDKNQVG